MKECLNYFHGLLIILDLRAKKVLAFFNQCVYTLFYKNE